MHQKIMQVVWYNFEYVLKWFVLSRLTYIHFMHARNDIADIRSVYLDQNLTLCDCTISRSLVSYH